MKYFFTSFIVFIFILSSYPSFADEAKDYNSSPRNEKYELYRFVDLYGGSWITWGEGSWEISFTGGKSKLEFKNIDSNMYMIGASIKPYFYFINIDFSYASGHIQSGKSIDSDWIDNYLFSKSESETDGDTKYWSLGLYVRLIPYRGKIGKRTIGKKKPPHLATLDGFFGWFHYEDKLDITNGVQIISTPGMTPPIGPFSGLNSEYDFEWEGYKIGVKYEWDFIKKPSLFLHAMGIKMLGAILFLVDYEGKGIWNLRDDFAQNPSFRQEADGGGLEGQIGLFYSPFRHIKIELAYHALQLEARDGKDTTFFSDGTTAETDLDKVNSDRHGILFLLSLYF